MDFNLTDEENQIREAIKKFMEREVLPLEQKKKDVIGEGRLTDEVMALGAQVRKKSVDLGYYTIGLPEEMGGGGLSHVAMTAMREEIAQSGTVILGLFVLGDPPMGPTGVLKNCTDYQKENYLGPLMRGEKTTCFALTEPGAGSDVSSIKTRAVKTGDKYIINGQKHFTSNGPKADFIQLFAVTDPEKGLGRGVSMFLVDADSPGFTRRPQRSMGDDDFQAELFFDDCEVPAENIVGTEGLGFVEAMKWLSAERLIVAIQGVGMAEYLLRLGIDYAKVREQFGKPIIKNQAIQWMLADSATEIYAAKWMTYHCAWLIDQGKDAMKEISMAKLFASEMAFRVADRIVQVHGGIGYMKELPVERFFRLARLLRIGGGTSEIQRFVIARSL
jgi:alkylation response protein AidB-like acyl-CoA dehydrogenase